MAVTASALITYLASRDAVYHGKILELAEAVSGWLEYIPHSFPHYTRHTIGHSEEVIAQLSKLLFQEVDGADRPVIPLSAVEAYILAAAAYLHDVGMVVSDSEKIRILRSEEWIEWTSSGGGKKRWAEIEDLRTGADEENEDIVNFLADVQTRFVIAEFVRRTHHLRSGTILVEHESALGRFAFNDQVLLRAIRDVCIGHGLPYQDLEDRERYPDRRDIRGEPTNVRFLAMLLRLGDLLDMSTDRACPLLLNVASPLPPESLAHWTQYQRIVHRLTAPDRIELIAECANQEEHRFLTDWCHWLVEETRNAGVLMTRSARHGSWEPPTARMDAPDQTIMIRPSETASYTPSKWTFELDPDSVFDRLIRTSGEGPRGFLREIVQNGLDANRCQLYVDLREASQPTPDLPTEVSAEWRERYPLKVSLLDTHVENPLSGEMEKKQLLVIEDAGLGMDRDVIRKYFLQVGRSYYLTDDFRRSFPFHASGQFGVGFLSVFSVSDRVIVDTFKPSSQSNDGPIRLTLTGPRNYLLTDIGARQSPGTRISILLRETWEQGQLTEQLRELCPRVEFPIQVDDLGRQVTIRSETPDDFTYEISDISEEGSIFAVKAFPFDTGGLNGEVYVFERRNSEGTPSWASYWYAQNRYPEKHPLAAPPPFPSHLICLNGIAHGHYYFGPSNGVAVRCDNRRPKDQPEPVQFGMHRHWHRQRVPEVDRHMEEVVREHLDNTDLARGETGWRYRQRLVPVFPIPSFWRTEPGMIPLYKEGALTPCSLEDLVGLPSFTTLASLEDDRRPFARQPHVLPLNEGALSAEAAALIDVDIERCSNQHRSQMFSARTAVRVTMDSRYVAIEWEMGDGQFVFRDSRMVYCVPFTNDALIGVPIHKTMHSVYRAILLNTLHPFVSWLMSIAPVCENEEYGLDAVSGSALLEAVCTTISYHGHRWSKLQDLLFVWRELPDLPTSLRPPVLDSQAILGEWVDVQSLNGDVG